MKLYYPSAAAIFRDSLQAGDAWAQAAFDQTVRTDAGFFRISTSEGFDALCAWAGTRFELAVDNLSTRRDEARSLARLYVRLLDAGATDPAGDSAHAAIARKMLTRTSLPNRP